MEVDLGEIVYPVLEWVEWIVVWWGLWKPCMVYRVGARTQNRRF